MSKNTSHSLLLINKIRNIFSWIIISHNTRTCQFLLPVPIAARSTIHLWILPRVLFRNTLKIVRYVVSLTSFVFRMTNGLKSISFGLLLLNDWDKELKIKWCITIANSRALLQWRICIKTTLNLETGVRILNRFCTKVSYSAGNRIKQAKFSHIWFQKKDLKLSM